MQGTGLVNEGSVLGIVRIRQDAPCVTLVFSAITDARILMCDYEGFCSQVTRHPQLMQLLFTQLQQRFLAAINERLVLVASQEADQAIAFTLRTLMDYLGDVNDAPSAQSGVQLPVVRQQIAMLRGKSVPSTNRVLGQLRQQGFVRLGRATVTVPRESPIASMGRCWT